MIDDTLLVPERVNQMRATHYPRVSTMIHPPRSGYFRSLTVDEEHELPEPPHPYQVARVESIAEADEATHIWTGRFWSHWVAWDWERDDHDVYLTEEPLRWPKTVVLC